jgi:hypothetical protein
MTGDYTDRGSGVSRPNSSEQGLIERGEHLIQELAAGDYAGRPGCANRLRTVPLAGSIPAGACVCTSASKRWMTIFARGQPSGAMW